MLYLELFWSFFQVGLFSFGGGYAAMPVIQSQVVDGHGWLSLAEFTDLIAISQMTPGPIAINSASFVGMSIAGIGGALIATAGCVLPSAVIVSVLAWLYRKYSDLWLLKGILGALRPTVVALILSAGMSMLLLSVWGESGFSWGIEAVDFVAVGLFLAGLAILRKFKTNPMYVMLGSGVLGGAIYLLMS